MWLKRLYSIETVTATNREPAHCERCTLKATTKRTVLPLDQERLPYLRGLVLGTCSLTSGNFPSVFATTLIASKVCHVLVYARGQRPCMAESARRRAAVVLNPTQSRHRVDDATVTSQASFSTPAPQPLCHLRLGRAWRRSSRPSPALWGQRLIRRVQHEDGQRWRRIIRLYGRQLASPQFPEHLITRNLRQSEPDPLEPLHQNIHERYNPVSKVWQPVVVGQECSG